jgi:hypothetical protein
MNNMARKTPVKMKRELYCDEHGCGIKYTTATHYVTVKKPYHKVYYMNLPRELTQWFTKEDDYCYFSIIGDNWVISPYPLKGTVYKRKIRVSHNQMSIPKDFPRGQLELVFDFNQLNKVIVIPLEEEE